MSLVPKIGFFFKLLRGHLGCGSGAVPIRSSPEASSDTGRGTGKEHATADLTGFSDLRKLPSNRASGSHKTQCRKTNRMILDYNDSFRPEIESRVENRREQLDRARPPGSWRQRCPRPFIPPCHQRGGRRRPEQAVSATGWCRTMMRRPPLEETPPTRVPDLRKPVRGKSVRDKFSLRNVSRASFEAQDSPRHSSLP